MYDQHAGPLAQAAPPDGFNPSVTDLPPPELMTKTHRRPEVETSLKNETSAFERVPQLHANVGHSHV